MHRRSEIGLAEAAASRSFAVVEAQSRLSALESVPANVSRVTSCNSLGTCRRTNWKARPAAARKRISNWTREGRLRFSGEYFRARFPFALSILSVKAVRHTDPQSSWGGLLKSEAGWPRDQLIEANCALFIVYCFAAGRPSRESRNNIRTRN